MRAINPAIQSANVLFILNTAYTVFLGVFVQYLFKIDTKTPTSSRPVITVLLCDKNLIPIGMLLSYFVLDWLTANLTVLYKNDVSHTILILLLITVGVLGCALVLAISPTFSWYLLISLYATFVTVWDLLVYRDRSDLFRSRQYLGIMLMIVAALRFIPAALMCFVIGIYWIAGHASLHQDYRFTFQVLFTLYLFFKIVRYIIYISATRPRPEPNP